MPLRERLSDLAAKIGTGIFVLSSECDPVILDIIRTNENPKGVKMEETKQVTKETANHKVVEGRAEGR